MTKMTKEAWQPYWELLCERWNVTLSSPMKRVYALMMDAEGITAEEWALAVTSAIRYEDSYRMPSPQKLLDYARPQSDVQAQAALMFQGMLDYANGAASSSPSDQRARELMKVATMGTPLQEVPTQRLTFVRNEFIEAYAKHLKAESSARMPALAGKQQALSDTQKELPHASD